MRHDSIQLFAYKMNKSLGSYIQTLPIELEREIYGFLIQKYHEYKNITFDNYCPLDTYNNHNSKYKLAYCSKESESQSSERRRTELGDRMSDYINKINKRKIIKRNEEYESSDMLSRTVQENGEFNYYITKVSLSASCEYGGSCGKYCDCSREYFSDYKYKYVGKNLEYALFRLLS